jgi:hypothetical protein
MNVRVLGVVLLAVSLMGMALSAEAAETPSQYDKATLYGGGSHLAKVSSHLLQGAQLEATGSDAAAVSDAVGSSRSAAEAPLIEISLDSLDDAIAEAVEATGFRMVNSYPRYGRMVGYADYDILDDLAAITEVATIRPVFGAVTSAGSVTNQADVLINADDARAEFSVDGSGLFVGIISDSFNSGRGGTVAGSGCATNVTGMDNQVSGDLPPAVVLLNDNTGSDEGAAMGELIHDLAPGAGLMFSTGVGSEAGLASAIDSLVSCGSDVIVEDVLFLTEPVFQDGPIAQAAQRAVDAGVPFFSSAGNQATFGIMADYADSRLASDDMASPPSGVDFHDFGGGNSYAGVTLEPGEGLRFVLQWNQPFDGMLGSGAAVDLDLYLLESNNPAATVAAQSVDRQGCSEPTASGDPLELLDYTNSTPTAQTLFLAIDHYCGTDNVEFRVATFGKGNAVGSLDLDTSIFNDAQIYGHKAAQGVAAVGAVFYDEIATGGSYPPGAELNVEPFSSSGGEIPIVFDADGSVLPGGPIARFQPTISAPDGTNTTFFGADSTTDPDLSPNFFGTSAAAAHAAAAAALMLEHQPSLTPAQVLSAMRSTAIDVEGPGRDDLSGDGLIDARDAVAATDTLDTTNPTWPGGGNITISDITATSARVRWSGATDNVGVAGYLVLGDGTLWGTTTKTSLDLSDLTSATTYQISVQAVDGVGNESTNGPTTTLATPLPPGGSFVDDNGNVHEGNIEAIAADGITRGCNPPINDKYCPADPVTRGQMAAFLVRALNLINDGGGNRFIDDDGSVFETDIAKLAAAGITKGCNPPINNNYCPNDPVTRGQMAAFLARALNLTDDGGGNRFIDDDGSVFETDIAKLAAAGITKGCNPPINNNYCPNDPVKRDQMASFLARALGLDPIFPP